MHRKTELVLEQIGHVEVVGLLLTLFMMMVVVVVMILMVWMARVVYFHPVFVVQIEKWTIGKVTQPFRAEKLGQVLVVL